MPRGGAEMDSIVQSPSYIEILSSLASVNGDDAINHSTSLSLSLVDFINVYGA